MSPEFRKVALIAAVLGLLVSLFVALRPDDDEHVPPTTTVAASEPSATTTGPSTGPGTIRLDYLVVGGRPDGGVARDSISRGRIVVLRIASDVADEVHVHGYDLTAEVGPGAPATIRFVADEPGRFEVELERSGLQIAELEVRP